LEIKISRKAKENSRDKKLLKKAIIEIQVDLWPEKSLRDFSFLIVLQNFREPCFLETC